MDIAIVILNWNGRDFLNRFLPSVVEHSPKRLGARVVVADNGSTDGSVEFLETNFPNVEIIRLDKNYGFTGGYNRALAKLEADYFLLLNSDVQVSDGWLAPLIERAESSKNIAAVMPKILSYAAPTYFEYAGAAGGYIDLLGLPYCRGRLLSIIEQDQGQYNNACQVFWASGAAMLVRASLYKSLGGLDEGYFAHMEEIDLCWRLKNLGYEVWVEPKSTVYHVGGGTLPNDSPRKLMLNFRNNLATLYKNLPAKWLFIIIFLRLIFDGCVALGYLVKGKLSLFRAVVNAHFAFYKMLPYLRKEMARRPKKLPTEMRGILLFKVIRQILLLSVFKRVGDTKA